MKGFWAVKTLRRVFYSDHVDKDKMIGATNQAVALLSEIRPRDDIEAMLAVQMVGAHNLAMKAMRRVALTDQTFAGRRSNVNHATRMMRTMLRNVPDVRFHRVFGAWRIVCGRQGSPLYPPRTGPVVPYSSPASRHKYRQALRGALQAELDGARS